MEQYWGVVHWVLEGVEWRMLVIWVRQVVGEIWVGWILKCWGIIRAVIVVRM